MSNTLSLLFAIVNIVVTGLFAAVVARQYSRRHRQYQLFWSIALSMAFVATLAYVLMVSAGPTSSTGVVFFRVYYILGGALMPAWLGLGSIALVARPMATRICLIVLSILSIIAAVLTALATIDTKALSQIAGTPGTGILQPGAWLALLITLNTLGVLAVVGVAIYSGWQLFRRQGASNLLWGNILILVGDLINAAAGTTARLLGAENTFWIIMTVGWIVFFVGVLFASRPRTRPVAQPSVSAQGQALNEGSRV